MAIDESTVEATDTIAPSRGVGATRRPIVLISGGLASLMGLGLWSLGKAPDDAAPRVLQEKPTILVPDHQSAAKLDAEERAAAGSLAAPPAGDRLPVTNGVGRADSSRAPPPGTLPPSALLAKQQEQLEKHALKLQANELALREQALLNDTRVKTFEDARRAEMSEAAALLNGSNPDGAYGGHDDATSLLAQAAGPQLAAMAAARPFGGTGANDSLGAGGTNDMRAAQADKLAFFQNGGDQLKPGRLEAQLEPPQSPYMLRMGAMIPGVLLTRIDSEAPGQITAIVSKDVFDSVSGNHRLIPQGAQIVGTYSGTVSIAQERVQGAAVRLNFPNGHALDLGGMVIADAMGAAGLRDRVNRHWLRKLGAFLLNGATIAAYNATQPSNRFGVEDAVHRGIGEAILKLSNELERQQLQIPPSLEIRSGQRFIIHVSKDIVFPGPYVDDLDRRSRR